MDCIRLTPGLEVRARFHGRMRIWMCRTSAPQSCCGRDTFILRSTPLASIRLLRLPCSDSAFSEQGVQDEIRTIPNFRPRAEKDDYFCEVIDANLGGLIAYFVVRTNGGSLRFRGGSATRDWAVMEAIGDQILTYSLPKGEEMGHFFGSDPTISALGLLAVQSESREVTVYGLATSQLRQQYTFAEPVAYKAFSADGKRLFILTNNQTAYLLDTNASLHSDDSVADATQK